MKTVKEWRDEYREECAQGDPYIKSLLDYAAELECQVAEYKTALIYHVDRATAERLIREVEHGRF